MEILRMQIIVNRIFLIEKSWKIFNHYDLFFSNTRSDRVILKIDIFLNEMNHLLSTFTNRQLRLYTILIQHQ